MVVVVVDGEDFSFGEGCVEVVGWVVEVELVGVVGGFFANMSTSSRAAFSLNFSG